MTTSQQQVHALWSAVAPRWGEHAAYVDQRGAHVTRLMIEATAPQPGDRVLELACGPGSVGLAVAPRVLPGGEVVMSDVSPEMTAIAAERAAAAGWRHVAARPLDLEQIAEPNASYDVVLCRDGLMFALDPARALAETRRVLRPGGRTAFAVWGAPERNPWLGLVFDAVSEVAGRPVPPPGVPGPFTLSDADTYTRLVTDAFDDVWVREVPVPLLATSFDVWWQRTLALAGPLAAIVSGMPDQARGAIVQRLRRDVAVYTTRDGIELPGLALLATGRHA